MLILIIDDNLFDRDLALRALKSLPGLEFDHALSFLDFKKKYSPGKYAAILSDYNLPGALGTNIFLYVRELEPGIPFIIFSGALGEERAVEILRMGVTDYVLKDKLDRLPLVLSRALKEAETQKAEKEGHQRLIASEEKFRKIFESISDVYFQTDKNGIYTLISPSCFDMTGYHPNELIGKRAGGLSKNPEEGVKLFSEILPREKKVTNFEITIVGKNGETIIASANISLIVDGNGNPSGFQGIFRDVTEKKKQDEDLIQARLASHTKSQFLANMSHEIRTPMNAIIGLSHLALKTDLTPKQTDYLKKIQGSSKSLLRIINDILDFSKIEAGKLTLEEVPFDLEEVFQKLADVITYKAHAKGLEIAFGIDSALPTYLIGDPVRLEQVLSNLCSNAVKFTDAGEVVIKAALAEDYGDSLRLQFEVTDTGIGMSKKQLSKLFEPFTQADDSISSIYGGTGLGLSIIKRLVELMDGTVWVKSEPGAGTTFYFTARLQKQEQQRIIPVSSVDLRKLSVLLVDDNKSAQKILREALESFSFEVVVADSGIGAVHFLKNNYHHHPVKLVLMDWDMPEMNGLRAAEIIRQDEQFKDIRIIMMCTSYPSDELSQKIKVLGLSGVLIKPIRHSRLHDTIMRAFDNGISTQQEKRVQKNVVPQNSGHLLLVEDNEINQQVASELLEEFGFTVDIASNGAEGVNKIKESGVPSRYNLVLMDLQMPIMGGYKATEQIRRLEQYKNLPIIAMTADAIAGVREKCLAVGMMDFITKPVDPNNLLKVVRKWIQLNGKETFGKAISPDLAKKDELVIPMMEGIDLDDGLSHLGGNRLLYHNLLKKFLDNNEHFMTALKEEFRSGSHEPGLRMIHTLKGVSGNLGMVKLFEICRKVQEDIEQGPGDNLDDLLRPLSEEITVVLGSLKKNMGK